ncbi:hypothetical protein ED733_005756 [Metarhizium rileyi]|uniref:Rhodopsin domain-containing protein n=1 Tax=Metarhizium rileyi (strain RCEF 4871) TaxID=1649241 RepID=A0A5C6GEI0_METRR|nr:hypothetical protein ED733_005756 [Metarhizium rileyi]
MEACNLTEALFMKNATETACNRPTRDQSGRYDAMNISMGVMTVLLVVIRLGFKKFFSHQRELGADDWLSLSLFYLYFFPGKTIRRLLMGTAIFNVLFVFTFVTTGIFQCSPVSRYWTQYVDRNASGYCININSFASIHGAFKIAIDVWMIVLSLSQIQRLELHWKKRVGVTFMFLLGTFVTVVSILRLQSLVNFANSTNPTWDNWIVGWWSTIEVNVGMICTCLPTVRLILVRMAPRIFSTNMSLHQSEWTKEGTGDRYGRSSNVMGHRQVELASIETKVVEEGDMAETEWSFYGARRWSSTSRGSI